MPDLAKLTLMIDLRLSPDFIEDLTTCFLVVLGDKLVGLYLWGSSVVGGFEPDASDLDLLAVLGPEVADLDLDLAASVPREFIRYHPAWRERLEIVYIGQATLWNFRAGGSLAHISRGSPLVQEDNVAEWLRSWHLIRTTGESLYGPRPTTLIPPIEETEFADAIVRYARRAGSQDLSAMEPSLRAYNILTLCRSLATLRTGRYGSKQEAATWLAHEQPRWSPLIAEALDTHRAGAQVGFEDPAMMALAAEFVAAMTAQIAQAAGASPHGGPSSEPKD